MPDRSTSRNPRRNQTPTAAPPAPPPPSFDSLFLEAESIKLWLKVFMWGTYGTRKTPTALEFPRPVVIDTHGGVRPYMGRTRDKFRLTPASNYKAVMNAINAARPVAGVAFETLILDDVSTILDSVRNEYLISRGYIGRQENYHVSLRMKDLYTALNGLNCNVVVIGREKPEYTDEGEKSRRVGVKAATDDNAPYAGDVIVHMTGDGGGVISRIRGLQFPNIGVALPLVNWSEVFAPIAQALQDGDDPADIRTQVGGQLFIAYWQGQGLNISQIMKALGVQRLREWKGTRDEADSAVMDFFNKSGKGNKPAASNWQYEAVKAEALEWFNHEKHLKNTLAKLHRLGVISNESANGEVVTALAAYIGDRVNEPLPPYDGQDEPENPGIGFGGV